MEIIHTQNNLRKNAFASVRGGKTTSEILHDGEKILLNQMSQILTVVVGGDTRNRRGLTA